ncbi:MULTISPECIES: class I SAM-dependent methyltransferase [Methylomonas]|uniref:class I SAM-dependent methyltransferase n=1 Tax=Methylomonas TaxID=416 RepID=UPI001232CE8C|nr:class I SAM-dependent methyltransferase [Methylomonas rhizoryzae]
MTADNHYDSMFTGIIGQEYQMLKLICPYAAEMSRLVGLEIGKYCETRQQPQLIVELGGGTGITTLSLLTACNNTRVYSIDSAATMQDQAKQSLHAWEQSGRLEFCMNDALTALRALPNAGADAIASAYTLHNFAADYRAAVIPEIYRVLKPGGLFVNGDRYALDDAAAHTRNTQNEVAGYFKVLTEINRLDLLEHWIIHLFNDESENHIMREGVALAQLKQAGFRNPELKLRHDVNALITAIK